MCAWDERAANGGGWVGAPRAELHEAQREFARSGAADPRLREFTRPARADEARPPWWFAVDDAAGVLIPEIERAFDGVTLAGGVSMAEAELIDDYALPARDERSKPPRGHGESPVWHELTTAGLNQAPWGNFSFQDARGIRFYLPGFMCADLSGITLGARESLWFTLGLGYQLPALLGLLTEAQRRAVARYLVFVAMRDDYDKVPEPWLTELDPEQVELLRGYMDPSISPDAALR